jgi:hypothetical protein
MNDRQSPTAINPDGVAERKFGDDEGPEPPARDEPLQ